MYVVSKVRLEFNRIQQKYARSNRLRTLTIVVILDLRFHRAFHEGCNPMPIVPIRSKSGESCLVRLQICRKYRVTIKLVLNMKQDYRVTHQVVTNLPLTSKQKFRFGLAWPGLARPGQAKAELYL